MIPKKNRKHLLINIKPMKLNIGSNAERIEGYKSVDLFAEADYKDDVRTMATFPNDSVEEVRAFHLLEHLPNKDVMPAMKAVWRILSPGGRFVIEVPSLPGVLKQFLETPEEDRWGYRLWTIFGMQNEPGQFHMTGFSDKRITDMLKSAGFSNVSTVVSYSEKYMQEVIDVEAVK